MRYGLFLTFLAVLVGSCIDESDYDLTSVEVNPTMALPLAQGDLTIMDMLKKSDSSYVFIDGNDQVYLEYHKTLLSNDIRGLFSLPDKIVNQSIPLVPGTIPPHANSIRKDSIVEIVDLGLSPEKLTEIDFKAGTVSYSAVLVPTNSNLPFEVQFTSTDLVTKAGGVPLSIKAPPSGSFSLADYKVALNNNKFNLKMVVVLKPTSSPSVIAAGSSLAVNFSMTGMDFNLVKGFLGDQTANAQESVLEIQAFGSSLDSASISFEAPSVSIDVRNDYGVPCKLDFIKFLSQKTGTTVNAILSPTNPVTLAAPSVVGTSANTHITATNAKQMMDIGPSQVVYQFNARINQGLTSGSNFMADTSKLNVTLNVTIPLRGSGSNIILRDTTKIDLEKVAESEILSASLKVDVTNEMPIGGTMQLYLADENNVILDSLLAPSQTSLVPPSVVTPSGDLESAATYNEVLPLNSDQLNRIFSAKSIIIKMVMNSSKDGLGNTQPVNFKSQYKVLINMGLLAQMKFVVEK